MPVKKLPAMKSLAKVKWKRTGLSKTGLATVAGGVGVGALVAHKSKKKRK